MLQVNPYMFYRIQVWRVWWPTGTRYVLFAEPVSDFVYSMNRSIILHEYYAILVMLGNFSIQNINIWICCIPILFASKIVLYYIEIVLPVPLKAAPGHHIYIPPFFVYLNYFLVPFLCRYTQSLFAVCPTTLLNSIKRRVGQQSVSTVLVVGRMITALV